MVVSGSNRPNDPPSTPTGLSGRCARSASGLLSVGVEVDCAMPRGVHGVDEARHERVRSVFALLDATVHSVLERDLQQVLSTHTVVPFASDPQHTRVTGIIQCVSTSPKHAMLWAPVFGANTTLRATWCIDARRGVSSGRGKPTRGRNPSVSGPAPSRVRRWRTWRDRRSCSDRDASLRHTCCNGQRDRRGDAGRTQRHRP